MSSDNSFPYVSFAEVMINNATRAKNPYDTYGVISLTTRKKVTDGAIIVPNFPIV